ncbi:hypothetical protein O9X80_11100 [Agrobacterium salinitolerans]|uniref:hypothetical protein n=1 Tax=Agrobacterium salinitolerans TaxID=1183413 RepID=UPI0022B810CF|nr:hypothetical protein [Agrobacterium salinitolerans]MCZ7975034.1 hypothetical protein [Agrobacterium salinitolerans]
MEITVWAYQITPGSDETLYFALSEEACRSAALEQREELRQHDPDCEELPAMALYEYVVRSMSAAEIIAVLNGEISPIDACAVSRRLIGLVVD